MCSDVPANYPNYYTQSFRLQISNDENAWSTVDTVTNNKLPITDRRINDVQARYVRLYIDKSDYDGAARIPEFQIYNDPYFSKPGDNQTLNKTATASISPISNELPAKAVNGTYVDVHDKWCSGQGNVNGSWLKVDLGKSTLISQWFVMHEKGAAVISNANNYYTRTYRFQVSDDNNSWRDVDRVDNNTAGYTARYLQNPVSSRYVRLYIDQADADNCARIYEFQTSLD